MAASLTSVPKSCTGMAAFLALVRSQRVMASEYTSSPLAHPGTQILTGFDSALRAASSGKISLWRYSKTFRSRKNEVTLIKMSS